LTSAIISTHSFPSSW